MIKRYYFIKTTTELTTGDKMYNDVFRVHKSFFRDDKAAYDAMTAEIQERWKDHFACMHVTDFKKL